MVLEQKVYDGFVKVIDGLYGAPIDFTLVTGETYRVVWDGEEYTCVAYDDSYGCPCIGNVSLNGEGDDTGEPFYMLHDESDEDIIFTVETNTSHTIAIYKV